MAVGARDLSVAPLVARRDIQGLRALAVGLVILDHVMLRPSGGFVGVDVFFVVSGFLITGLLVREHIRSGRISFRGFYVRRARRILPVSTLVLVLTVSFAFLLYSAQRAASVFVDGVWAALFAANWRMALTNVDYFQSTLAPSPLQHYWSLSVEEQFYFVWPALMVAVFALTARWSEPRGNRWLRVALAVIVSITLTSFAISVMMTSTNPEVAYFSTLTRVWELGIGAALAIALQRVVVLPTWSRVVLTYLGLATIVISAVLITPETPFPGSAAVFPVIGAALVIFAGHGSVSPAHDHATIPLTNPVANYLGDISYSLYLWHFPVAVFALEFLPRGVTYYVLVLSVTLGLSALSYHLLENPVRRSRWLEPTGDHYTRKAIVGTICTAIVAAAALMLVYPSAERTAATTTIVTTEGGACDGAAVRLRPDCVGQSSEALLPAADQIALDTDGAFDAPCWRNYQAPPTSCTFGDEADAPVRVALIGDSHAAMYLPLLKEIADERGWYLEAHVGWGCQWIITTTEDCSGQQAAAQSRLLDGDPFDLVITSASRHVTSEWTDQQLDEARVAWTQVANRGTAIAVIADVPMLPDSAVECVRAATIDPRDNDCGTAESEALAMTDKQPQLAESVPNATVVDLMELYCWDQFCPAAIGSVAVYRDGGGHLTATWSRTLRSALEERLLAAMS